MSHQNTFHKIPSFFWNNDSGIIPNTGFKIEYMHFIRVHVLFYGATHHIQTIIINECSWIYRLMRIHPIHIQSISI